MIDFNVDAISAIASFEEIGMKSAPPRSPGPRRSDEQHAIRGLVLLRQQPSFGAGVTPRHRMVRIAAHRHDPLAVDLNEHAAQRRADPAIRRNRCCRHHGMMVAPPLTISVWPVINEPPGPARNTTAAPISVSGSPRRPSGIAESDATNRPGCSSPQRSAAGVPADGQMTLTVIWWTPHSFAATFVRPRIPSSPPRRQPDRDGRAYRRMTRC